MHNISPMTCTRKGQGYSQVTETKDKGTANKGRCNGPQHHSLVRFFKRHKAFTNAEARLDFFDHFGAELVLSYE